MGFASVVSRALLNAAMAITITNAAATPASAPPARLAEFCVLVVWLGMLGKIESVVGGCGAGSATLAARCCSSACAKRRMSAGVSIISRVSSSRSASKSAVPPGGTLIIASR